MAKEIPDMRKQGSFPMTWLSFKGICAFWNSRSVTGRTWVASDFKAVDNYLLQEAARETPSDRMKYLVYKEGE